MTEATSWAAPVVRSEPASHPPKPCIRSVAWAMEVSTAATWMLIVPVLTIWLLGPAALMPVPAGAGVGLPPD